MADEVREVSFPYRGELLTGKIVRLNKKTVTVETESTIFRVPYSLLTPKVKAPQLKKSNQSKKTSKTSRNWSKKQSKDYEKSNTSSISPLKSTQLKTLHVAVRMLAEALMNEDEEAVNEMANETIDELNRIYNLPFLKIYTGGKRRFTRGGGQYYGVYRSKGGNKSNSISVYSRTAKTQKFVAPKTFLRTLVHEWGHHYDKHKLNLNSTYHTKGFYERINTIYNQLKQILEHK